MMFSLPPPSPGVQGASSGTYAGWHRKNSPINNRLQRIPHGHHSQVHSKNEWAKAGRGGSSRSPQSLQATDLSFLHQHGKWQKHSSLCRPKGGWLNPISKQNKLLSEFLKTSFNFFSFGILVVVSVQLNYMHFFVFRYCFLPVWIQINFRLNLTLSKTFQPSLFMDSSNNT